MNDTILIILMVVAFSSFIWALVLVVPILWKDRKKKKK